jgi:hypothetical protein
MNFDKVKKVVVIVLASIFMLDILITVYLNVSYMHSRPTAPDAALGRTVAHNVHGTVVYLTEDEVSRLGYLHWGALGSFIGVAIAFIFRSKGR